ncbi:hypothetical protein ABWH96_05325 [Marivirga tractuosa]|uniref:hypothetical protein n=1 Tax=Marivirga tractuosa TaxID=1006 RepID=UPI0035CFD3DC
MSTIAAILKKEGQIKEPLPLNLYDDFCLSNLLQNSEKYEEKILEQIDKASIETLTQIEHQSLVIHNDYAFTNEELEYRKSVGEKLPKEYKATYLKYDYESEKFIYQEDFKDHETWCRIEDIKTAVEKLLKMMELEKQNGLHTVWNGSYLDDNICDIKILLENLKIGQADSGADEVLLVFKYN